MEVKVGSETDYNIYIKKAQNRVLTNTVLQLKVRMYRMKNNSGKGYYGLLGRMGNSCGTTNFEI